MRKNKVVSVLFVCMGNICRSPTAEGAFKHADIEMEGQIKIDSAGTHGYHVGESPDHRSQATAKEYGVDISSQKARKAMVEDFQHFDYIIAMDRSNYEDLKRLTTNEASQQKLSLFMAYSKEWDDEEVPDPYYGNDGFKQVFDMVQSASEGLLKHIVDNNLK